MKKRTSLLALAAIMTASTATAAMAADLAPPPPPAPEIRPSVADWTGPYIGVVGGGTCMETRDVYRTYSFTDNNGNGTYDPGIDTRDTAPSDELHFDMNGCGFTGGIVGGFNYQVDSFLFGIEGDWVWGGRTGDHDAYTFVPTTRREQDAYDIDWMTSLRIRTGILTTDSTLLYLTGGPAWIRGEMKDVNSGVGFKNTHFGWTIGGGVEHALTESIHLRAEYLFASFKRKDYGRFCTTCDIAVDIDKGMNQFHTFRAGVTWNFGISDW